jgi:hypothetical protein
MSGALCLSAIDAREPHATGGIIRFSSLKCLPLAVQNGISLSRVHPGLCQSSFLSVQSLASGVWSFGLEIDAGCIQFN